MQLAEQWSSTGLAEDMCSSGFGELGCHGGCPRRGEGEQVWQVA